MTKAFAWEKNFVYYDFTVFDMIKQRNNTAKVYNITNTPPFYHSFGGNQSLAIVLQQENYDIMSPSFRVYTYGFNESPWTKEFSSFRVKNEIWSELLILKKRA